MKKLGLYSALVVSSLLAYACGDDGSSTDGAGGDGSSSGGAGASGAPSANAGTPPVTAGGGTGPVGAAGAATGAAGAATAPAVATVSCPAAEPVTGDACMVVMGGNAANRCSYADSLCTCTAGMGGAADAFNCVTPLECPATEPATGDVCTAVPGGNAANQCTFDATLCTCQNAGGGAQAWNCVTPIECPATAPATGDACTVVPGGNGANQCTFDSSQCTCTAGMGGAADAWTCLDMGPLVCPAAAPMNGDACTPVAGGNGANQCMFDTAQCTCAAGMGGAAAAWTCLDVGPLMCPAAAPTNGDACTPVAGGNAANQCTFDTLQCTCGNGGFGGGGGGATVWNCVDTGPLMCPATTPVTGDACTVVQGGNGANSCTYADAICTCTAGMGGAAAAFNCVTPLACPATAPVTGDACAVVPGGNMANRCPYDASVCTCTAGMGGAADAFNCVAPIMCPAVAPATGDACTPVGGGPANNTCPFGAVNCVCNGGTMTFTCM